MSHSDCVTASFQPLRKKKRLLFCFFFQKCFAKEKSFRRKKKKSISVHRVVSHILMTPLTVTDKKVLLNIIQITVLPFSVSVLLLNVVFWGHVKKKIHLNILKVELVENTALCK